jgi:hypothetical protein
LGGGKKKHTVLKKHDPGLSGKARHRRSRQ